MGTALVRLCPPYTDMDSRKHRAEPLQKLFLGACGGPGRQVVAADAFKQTGVAAEQAPGFRIAKAGEIGGLRIGRAAVGGP